jgi:pimeloyl-ACP methyl ester carboxylesterase
MNLSKRLRRLIQGIGFCLLASMSFGGWSGVATAATLDVNSPKVVLLLHGLSSNLTTWNKLVDNRVGFDRRCGNTGNAKFFKQKVRPNSEGIYCMRFNFGRLDRISTAPKGLDNATCSRSGGCAGSYSTFETLGTEIDTAISRIKRRLGDNTQIVFLAHSSGGIAARAFLQSNRANRQNVVGLITTGTPHSGTPLGRYFNYMSQNCLPESSYDSLFNFSNCARDWRFTKKVLKKIGDIDLRAPGINFLSDNSPQIRELNNTIGNLPNILFTEITYDRINFGCLGKSLTNRESGCGYNIFNEVIRPSNNGLNFVLNGRSRAELRGDGIVPIFNQKMSNLKGWSLPIISYNRNSRVHIEESKQVRDLSIALANIYRRLGWL